MTMDQEETRASRIRPTANGVALALVVIITAWAAFITQNANEQVASEQEVKQDEDLCTSRVVFTAIRALNERTQFNTVQAGANVALQQAQLNFIRIILNPEAPDDRGREALEEYFDALTEFTTLVNRTTDKAKAFPYPTPSEYTQCLAEARER